MATIVFGVDVARQGEDMTVVAIREDSTIIHIEKWGQTDTMETVGRIHPLLRRYKPDKVVVDLIGIGSGVFDRLREQQMAGEIQASILPFNASAGCDRTDVTGEMKFANMRSYAWWNMRTLLQPWNPDPVLLPDDNDLIRELTAPKFKHTSGGKIQIESKDDIRKMIGKSTDVADAVIMAFCDLDPSMFEDAYRVYTDSEVREMQHAITPPPEQQEISYAEMQEKWREEEMAKMWEGAMPIMTSNPFD